MNKEEFKALFSSVARIEWLIKIIMQEKYGTKEANRVYQEVADTIEKAFNGEADNKWYYKNNVAQ